MLSKKKMFCQGMNKTF